MKSPVSLSFVAAGIAAQGKYYAGGFEPSRRGVSPSWEGRGGRVESSEARTPITAPSYWAGRWALCPLTLRNEDGKTRYFADAVASVSCEKRILCTSVTGQPGSVKEYIGDGDWQVSLILGIQSSVGGEIMDEYPEEELGNLLELLDDNRPLRIHSAFLELFGIDRIVVKSRSAVQMTESNYQEVSVSAVSDREYELWSNEY